MRPERVPHEFSVREPTQGQPNGEKRRQERQRAKAQVVSIESGTGLIWRGAEYPVLAPGVYCVRGVKVQGPEWVRKYRRWSVRVEFALVTEPGAVSVFLNLGSNPERPNAGRQSNFYKAWVIANGEHPRKGQAMNPEIFLDGQFFEVEVESCNRDENGGFKPDVLVYSRVTKIISARLP